MSATAPPPIDAPPAGACPHCGAPLRPDQDWCLSCGAAVTTQVAGARGWRTPVAIVGAVLLLAAAALVVAFVKLSDDATQVASATPTPAPTAVVPPAAVVPTATPSASAAPVLTPSVVPSVTVAPSPVPGVTVTPSPVPGVTVTPSPGASTTPAPGSTPAGSGAVAGWPSGTTAYTVIMYSGDTRAQAEAKAKSFTATSVGVLHSDDYSSLRPGYWVVFSGQYDTLKVAQDAAKGLQSTAPGAYAKQVKPK